MQANLLSQPSEISQSRRAWAWPLCRCLVKAAVAASALLVFTAGFFWFFQDTTSGMSWMQALQHAATLFALFTSASFVMVFRQCQERTQLHQQLAECHTQLQQLQRQHADHTTHQQSLVELIKLRASQINGCANCVDLHANTLRKLGESETRLQSLVVWWESPEFNEREKAALAWCEAVTLVSKSKVSDEVFERANAQFTDKELVDLTFGIITINNTRQTFIVSNQQSLSMPDGGA